MSELEQARRAEERLTAEIESLDRARAKLARQRAKIKAKMRPTYTLRQELRAAAEAGDPAAIAARADQLVVYHKLVRQLFFETEKLRKLHAKHVRVVEARRLARDRVLRAIPRPPMPPPPPPPR